MVTKKDFKAVAEIIRIGRSTITNYSTNRLDVTANKLADYFATQNPRFDRDRFMKTCGLDKICSVCNKKHQVK